MRHNQWYPNSANYLYFRFWAFDFNELKTSLLENIWPLNTVKSQEIGEKERRWQSLEYQKTQVLNISQLHEVNVEICFIRTLHEHDI